MSTPLAFPPSDAQPDAASAGLALPSEDAVRTAARLVAGAVAVTVAGVLLHALGTVRRLLRRV